MDFNWNQEKNEILKKERNISFERIVVAIEEGKIRDILTHPNQEKYKNQFLILLEIDSYIWVVPAVKDESSYFLKTAFPSRKFTALYLEQKGKP